MLARLAVTSKKSDSKVNGTSVLCFVLDFLGLLRMQPYVECWANQKPPKASYSWHET